MPVISVTVRRTSVYRRDVPTLPSEDDLLDVILDIANGDEVDGSTDYVGAWDEAGKQIY